MARLDIHTVLGWRGNTVRDRDGEKVGTIGYVFLDRETDRPAWVGVKTGFFGAKQSYVSLSDAEVVNGEIQLPYVKQLVATAPHVEPDISLTPEEEESLYRHYGQDYAATGDRREDGAEASGRDDDAMTRSEEEVRLGHVERRPAKRVRIRKVMVTDHVKQVVPVRREVVQLEHEPPPAGRIESVEGVGEPGPP